MTTSFPYILISYEETATDLNNYLMDTSEILCNFDVYAIKKELYSGFLRNLEGTSMNIGAYCSTHITENTGTSENTLSNGFTFDDHT